MATMRMRHGCALALMVVVGLMAGCSGKVADSGGIEEPDFGDEVTDWQELGESDTDVGFEAAEDPVGEPDLYPPAEPTLADPEMGSGSEPGWEPTAVDHTQVVTIGDLALRSDTPADTFERAKEIAIQVGGIVESASVHGEDPKDQSVSATMRIPSDRFSGAVDTIKTLGRVAGWQQSSTDVGADVVDLDARISGMRASITRLEVMVSEASSTEVLLDVESMLSQRQVELESLLSQRAYYADQVSLSTLNLSINPIPTKITPTNTGLGASFQRGWDSFVIFVTGVLHITVFLAPWLVPIAVITVLIVVLARRRRRRRPPRAPRPIPPHMMPGPPPPGVDAPGAPAPGGAPGSGPVGAPHSAPVPAHVEAPSEVPGGTPASTRVPSPPTPPPPPPPPPPPVPPARKA